VIHRVSAPRTVDGMQRSTRRRAYFALMGGCLLLILLAWNVVRHWSTTAAVVMSIVAAVIPPIAAIVANLGGLDDSQLPSGEVRNREPDPTRPPGPAA
jgi:hypothetical protein